jgi:cell division protein WhiA
VSEGGFSAAVRMELSSLPVPSEREARAELVGMLLMSGGAPMGAAFLRDQARDVRPGDLSLSVLCRPEGLVLDVASSAVARRGFALMLRSLGLRPTLSAVTVTGRLPVGPSYRVALPIAAVQAREEGRSLVRAVSPSERRAGVADRSGEEGDEAADPETVALLRGAIIVGGSFSAPERATHFELAPVTPVSATLLAAALSQVLGTTAAHHDVGRRRLVLKSGAVVTDLLAATGATRAFLTFDDRRLRRQLRSEANRLANADAANLARTAAHAGDQVDAIRRAVDRHGWELFDAELRRVALARLANPSASVTELAQLLELSRTTLHRRLQRVEENARQADATL